MHTMSSCFLGVVKQTGPTFNYVLHVCHVWQVFWKIPKQQKQCARISDSQQKKNTVSQLNFFLLLC